MNRLSDQTPTTTPPTTPPHSPASDEQGLIPSPKRGRQQRTIIVYGILSIVLILVVMQLWLLTATMNAFLGGDEAVIWPAAWASTVCLLLNLGLLVYLYRMERE